MLAAAHDARRVIAITPQGKPYSSETLAEFLRRQLDAYGRLAFLLGGPSGLSGELLAHSDETLSLSMMTFPHELARIVCLEQLYRAFTILAGEKYHR